MENYCHMAKFFTKKLFKVANFFSENLVYLRDLVSLSQDDFAIHMKKSKRTIGNWENGKTEPSLSELVQLSTFFKVPVGELIGENLSNKPPDYLQQVLKRMDTGLDAVEVIDTLKDVSSLLEELSLKISETASRVYESAKHLEAKAGIPAPSEDEIF